MYKKLIVFRAVAKHENITAAADSLHMTQSAVSKTIRQLEETFGATLFERQARGVALTELGQVLLDHAREVELSERDARTRMQSLIGGDVRLRIGAGAQWAHSILPGAILELRKSFPNYRADIVVGTMDLLLPLLVKGELDVAITQGKTFEHPDLERHFVAEIPIRAVCREDHPLHDRRPLSHADMLRYDWVNFRSIGPHAAGTDETWEWPPSVPEGARIVYTASSWNLGIQILSQSYLVMGIPEGLLPIAAKFGIRPVQAYPPITALAGFIWVRKPRTTLPIIDQLNALLKQGL